jgi:transposase
LGYLFNIASERRLCAEASLNLAWRRFVGYELDEPLPDHRFLSKARKRYGVRVFVDHPELVQEPARIRIGLA